MNHESSTNQRNHLKLRFGFFAVAWLLGAILFLVQVFAWQQKITTPTFAIGALFTLMIPFTLMRHKFARILGTATVLLLAVAVGFSIAFLGSLLQYNPFIWYFIAELVLLALLIEFVAARKMKQAFNLAEEELNKRTLPAMLVLVLVFTLLSYGAVWYIAKNNKYYRVDHDLISATRIVLTEADNNTPVALTPRHIIKETIPLPTESQFKSIFRVKGIEGTGIDFTMHAVTPDNIIVSIGEHPGT